MRDRTIGFGGDTVCFMSAPDISISAPEKYYPLQFREAGPENWEN